MWLLNYQFNTFSIHNAFTNFRNNDHIACRNIIRCTGTVHSTRCLNHKCWETIDHTTSIPARLYISLNYLHTHPYIVINKFPSYTMDQNNLKYQVIPKINAESHSNLWHNEANEGNSRDLELASRTSTICAIHHGRLGSVVKAN